MEPSYRSSSTSSSHSYSFQSYVPKNAFDEMLQQLDPLPSFQEIQAFKREYGKYVEFVNDPNGIYQKDETKIAKFFLDANNDLSYFTPIHACVREQIRSFLEANKGEFNTFQGMIEVLSKWCINSTQDSTHQFGTSQFDEMDDFQWGEGDDRIGTGGYGRPVYVGSSKTVHMPKNDGTCFANLVYSDYIEHPNLMRDLRIIHGLECYTLALDIYNHPGDLYSTPRDRLLGMFRSVFKTLSPGHDLQGAFRQFFVDRLQTIASKVEAHEFQELQRLAEQQASHQYSHFEYEYSFVRHEEAESFDALQERFSSYWSFNDDLRLIESLQNSAFSKALYNDFETYCNQQHKQFIFPTFKEVLTELSHTDGLQGAYRQFFEDRVPTLYQKGLIEFHEFGQLSRLIRPQDEMKEFQFKPDGSSTPPPYFLIAWGVVALAASIPYIWIPAFKGARSLVNRVFYNQQPIPVPKGPKV